MGTETIPIGSGDGSRLDSLGSTASASASAPAPAPAHDRPTEPGTSIAETVARDGSAHGYARTEADAPTLGVTTEPGETFEGRDGPSANRAPHPSRPRYERLRLHAQGGVGQVWVSLDGRFGREVALKELRPERQFNVQTAARFLAEARVTGRLVHPGIVAVHDLGEGPDGSPYYTMPFVAGKTLEGAIADHHRAVGKGLAGGVERNALLMALVAVCNAVAYAHSRGIIHRDLKGQNVILGEFGESILLDWGLAKSLDPADADWQPTDGPWLPAGATQDGQVMGTPAWMAPEQAEGRADLVGTRTDVYALGAILFHILTGRAPFDGVDSRVIIEKVRKEAPPTPRQVVPGTSKALDAVCRKAMMRDPAARYASPLDLAADIQRWLADEPVSALKEGISARLGRWGRRHRSAVAAGLILVCVGLIGLAISNVVYARLRQEALAAKARSDRHFDLAREAVDKMLLSVGDDRLAHVPQMVELRRTLMAEALDFYETFLRAGGSNPRVRLDAASAYRRAANIERYSSHFDEARPLYRRSIDLLNGLVAEARDRPEAQQRLAETLCDAGDAEGDQGHLGAATPLYLRARDIAEALLATRPDSPGYREAVGHCELGLAALLGDRGDLPGYLAAAEAAATRLGPLADAPGARADLRSLWFLAEANRAQALGGLGRAVEAEAALRTSLARSRAFLAAAPTDQDRRMFVAEFLGGLGTQLAKSPDRGVEALGLLDEAIDRLGQIAADYPEVASYRVDLGKLLGERGRLRATPGSIAAAADFRRSIEVLEASTTKTSGDPRPLAHIGRTKLAAGRLLVAEGRPEAARRVLGEAVAALLKAVAASPEAAEDLASLAEAREALAGLK